MFVGATARGLTHGFEDHISQAEAENAQNGVQYSEEYGVVGQEPGNILGQHAVNGFTVTDHGSPAVMRFYVACIGRNRQQSAFCKMYFQDVFFCCVHRALRTVKLYADNCQ
jgi:hypothetical protein